MNMKNFKLTSLFKKKEKPVLGIDVGSHTIKLAEFAGSGKNRTLRTFGRAMLPPDVIVDGSIKDHETVGNILRNLISSCQPKIKRVATSISGYSVIVKRIHVPYSNEKDIEENLLIEAEKYVPFEIDDVYIDFSILKNTQQEDVEGTDIFLVAAKKEIVDAYAGLMEAIGLTPAVIDVDAFTLVNAFEMAFGDVSEPAVLIDIGASKTNLNIIQNGMPVFARDMAIGGEQLTEAIQEATGLSRDDAEAAKISGTKDKVLAEEIRQVVVEMADLWLDEIKKAINFFKSNAKPEEFPTHIFLSGGCALLKDLEAHFSKGLEIEATKLNPFSSVDHSKEIDPAYMDAVSPQMAIASGLAIRSAE
jgi:type IV pilus assembly protein PilM